MIKPQKISQQLVAWYEEAHRELPWRKNRDPYRIWISECMLQQTTTTAVIPYFERFMKRFPNLKSLATATQDEVLKLWAGLGYYSRARNLHWASQLFYKNGGFPKTYEELIEYPGFGPYTARAVASLAFDQAVGVVDGNVIRVLSRYFDMKGEWWATAEKNKIQQLADTLASQVPSHFFNQAIMELGATTCTPKSPKCLMCPWAKTCQALANGTIERRPLPKPRRQTEHWLWTVDVQVKKDQVLLVKNEYAPFLKNQWLLPGTVVKLKEKPKTFDLTHSITHHQIYAQIEAPALKKKPLKPKSKSTDRKSIQKWVSLGDVVVHNPSALLQKILEAGGYASKDAQTS